MKYAGFQRKMVSITLLVSVLPLIILGATIYYRFAQMHKLEIKEQMIYRARAQAGAVDLFLKERTAILSAVADTHAFQYMIQQKNLAKIFEVMNLRAGAFVDLGVIDTGGRHLAYVGPYDLRGLNYYQQPWFGEVMGKGVYISDVYMGFRRIPHFIIAVRRQENEHSWILRATIDPDIFGGIVRAAKVGKTGDAYIINDDGLYQTRPRFYGEILWESGLDGKVFGAETTVIEKRNGHGRKLLYAGSWLKNQKWLLIISQEHSEEMSRFFSTKKMEISIIICAILAIILATIFTTRLAVNRLRESDLKMNELNAQLVQTDKLAALGKMAASVAHEINNPLATILQKTGWMEDLLAEEEFQRSKNVQEYIESIRSVEDEVERAGKVVHSMLGYARRMEPHLEDVDVNEILNQTIVLLDNYARINNITIETDLASDLPIISSDQAQLQQVFLNLISNAIDAIGKDGLVEVKSKKGKSHIAVVITDNGAGIPKDQQRKIFDPFFTTKQTGKGTGLGLWISYSIIEKMGGAITLDSEVGKGSTFTVEIPIVVPEKK